MRLSLGRPLRFWPATLCAVLSGLLYFAAFPGLDLGPLAFVALVPLMVAIKDQPARIGLWLGWVSGFTMTMSGFYWLLEMLRVFSGFPTALCILFMSLLSAYQAGRMALTGWLTARGAARGWPFGTTFTLSFAAGEFLFPLLFPWYFGATVHNYVPLLQTAELAGPIATSLVVIAANFVIYHALLLIFHRQQGGWRRIIAPAAVFVCALIFGWVRVAQVRRTMIAAPKATVGLVQANMSLYGKRHDMDEGLQRHLSLTRQLKEQHPLDLVVWSETSVMRPIEESETAAAVPQAFSRRLGVPALSGSVLVRLVPDEREYVFFNSAIATDGAGEVTGRYDKTYLLAFGEYLPFGDTFPILYRWSPNSGHFSQGTSLDPLKLAGHWVSANICYEDLYPSFVNRMFRHHDADLIVNMTNDAWFGDTLEPWQHLALAKFRAIEQRRYLIRSTNSGVSAFVDPTGAVLSRTNTFVQTGLTHEVAWLKGGTVYRTIGDWPWLLASAASFALAFRRRKRDLATG